MDKKQVKIDDSLDEIKRLAEESDRNSGLDLGLEDDPETELIQLNLINDSQNPVEAYRLYYAIEGILRTQLPPRSKSEFTRLVREEKIIFLTGGKKMDQAGRRGADSRQAYIATHLEVALNRLLKWIQEGGTKFGLFLIFRELNIEYGYFKKEQLADVDQKKQAG